MLRKKNKDTYEQVYHLVLKAIQKNKETQVRSKLLSALESIELNLKIHPRKQLFTDLFPVSLKLLIQEKTISKRLDNIHLNTSSPSANQILIAIKERKDKLGIAFQNKEYRYITALLYSIEKLLLMID